MYAAAEELLVGMGVHFKRSADHPNEIATPAILGFGGPSTHNTVAPSVLSWLFTVVVDLCIPC